MSRALRHLYTAANAGRLAPGAFQTVACATELGAELDTLEELVARHRDPEPEKGLRARLAIPHPGDPRRWVLSTITPSGACPDGRPGNLWAESLVVPASWLNGAAWDLDAAFAALEWWGPERGAAHLGGWPCELAPETLPDLRPGSAERLDRLRTLPAEILPALAAGLLHQRQAGAPFAVAAHRDQDPADFERLLLLAPLLLPPDERVGDDEGHRPGWALCTRGLPADWPEIDLIGLPASAVPRGLEEQQGTLLDLGGRRPPPSFAPATAARGRLLADAVARGDWVLLSGGDPAMKTPKSPSPETKSNAQRNREDMWAAIDRAEGEAWSHAERFHAELQQLEASHRTMVETAVREAREAMQGEVDRLQMVVKTQQEQLAKKVAAERDALKQTGASAIADLERKRKSKITEIKNRTKDLERELDKVGNTLLVSLEKAFDSKRIELQEHVDKIATSTYADSSAPGRPQPAVGTAARPAPPKDAPTPPEPSTGSPFGGFAAQAKKIQRLPLKTFLGAMGVFLLIFFVGPSACDKLGRDTEPAPGQEPEEVAAPSTEELRSQIRARLDADGATRRILERAWDQTAHRNDAAAVAAALRLRQPMDAAASNALLQATLNRQSGTQLTVDGQLGATNSNSRNALATAAGETCTEPAIERRAPCVVAEILELEVREQCPLGWPLQRSCWSLADARKIYGLIQSTRGLSGLRADLATALGEYDSEDALLPDLALDDAVTTSLVVELLGKASGVGEAALEALDADALEGISAQLDAWIGPAEEAP